MDRALLDKMFPHKLVFSVSELGAMAQPLMYDRYAAIVNFITATFDMGTYNLTWETMPDDYIKFLTFRSKDESALTLIKLKFP